MLVASVGKGLLSERVKVAAALWAAHVGAELVPKAAPNLKDQLHHADAQGIPFVVLLGEAEVSQVRCCRGCLAGGSGVEVVALVAYQLPLALLLICTPLNFTYHASHASLKKSSFMLGSVEYSGGVAQALHDVASEYTQSACGHSVRN